MGRHAKQRSAVTNGTRTFLEPVPGNSEAARRYRDILERAETERGGRAAMGLVQQQAARTYAGLSVRLEQLHADLAAGRPVDPEALGQLGDRLDRAGRRMGAALPSARVTGLLERHASARKAKA